MERTPADVEFRSNVYRGLVLLVVDRSKEYPENWEARKVGAKYTWGTDNINSPVR
jgi:hypothetical protein